MWKPCFLNEASNSLGSMVERSLMTFDVLSLKAGPISDVTGLMFTSSFRIGFSCLLNAVRSTPLNSMCRLRS